ncbi:hypothetical protein BD779DRAFT_1553065 [Infundibulicybe gibba]|nr:hypothetical protein BD779DRAFT_1553065 [Infundibulicybe gibba]
MVPCTWTGGRPQKYRYNGKFFWGPDIEQIGAEWVLLQDDIQAHVEGAGERAAVYQEQRVREVRCITGYANRFHSWIHNLGVKALKKAIEKRMARFDGIRMRLLALGYDARDITYTAFHPPEFQEGSELTDKLWTHIQPRAVALVQSRRDARLEGERVRIRIWRITSVAPRQWCYLPDVRDLIEFPVFKSIVEDDSNISIPSSRFLRAAEQFPTVPLDLAASVFECTSGPQFPLISWEAIAAHSCQLTSQCLQMGHAPTSVGVSHLGRITAATLVREVGLDPASATIMQMDALDLRFTSVQQSWSCSHCAHYFNDWRWKRDVTKHLRDVHGIASPTEPTDLFWYPGKDSTLSSYDLGSIDNITEPISLDEVNV